MKFWILVMAAVALLVWSLLRERFEPTSKIKAPPYDDMEKVRIYGMVSSANASTLKAKAKQEFPTETNDTTLAAKAGGYVSPAVEAFYTTVYKPGSSTITSATVDTFMKDRTGDLKDIEKDAITAYFVNQASVASSGYLDILAGMGQKNQYEAEHDNPPPVCPAGTILSGATNKCVSQTVTATPSCPSGYTMGTDKTCHRDGGTETTDPVCPGGYTYTAAVQRCDSTPVDPTCPGDFEYKSGRCVTKAGSGASSGSGMGSGSGSGSGMGSGSSSSSGSGSGMGSGSGSGSGMGSGATGATGSTGATGATGMSGGTTGGSSVSSYGPNSGGGGGSANRLRQVFGPQFTGGGGDLSGMSSGDSSQTNVYPELLGGLMDTSTRIPGAGVQAPSKNWTLANNGTLPPSKTTGSDPMAQYFPYSRVPGDMDVIPDPYRVAQTFSPSSYSSKTEPVPFLADFSAFQK